MEVFGRRLEEWYHSSQTGGEVSAGRMLDVGGTGNTRYGMRQVHSKFYSYTAGGRLDYYVQDVDPAARQLNNSYVCDIADCPQLPSCGFDLIMSHVVLEHVRRPWDAISTISRATRRGGLSLHVVPFSHNYETIMPHYFHFSHEALVSLFEDNGFEVLETGYDLCTVHPRRRKDKKIQAFRMLHMSKHRPHMPFVESWLVYIVARKL